MIHEKRVRDNLLVLKELGLLRLALLVQKADVPEEMHTRYDSLFSDDLNEETVHITENDMIVSLMDDPDPAAGRLERVISLCRSEVALALLELCVLRAVAPETARLFELAGSDDKRGVSIMTAARAAGFMEDLAGAVTAMADARQSAMMLLCPVTKEQEADFVYELWRADPCLLDYLAEGCARDDAVADLAVRSEPDDPAEPVYGFGDRAEALGSQIKGLIADMDPEGDGKLTVIVEGERESGRSTSVRLASKTAGLRLLAADFSRIMAAEDRQDIIRRMVRCLVLEERALCIRGVTKSEDTMFLLDSIQRSYTGSVRLPLFITAETGVKPASFLAGDFLYMKIPADQDIVLALWKGFFAGEGDEVTESLASRMTLTAGQVKRVAGAVRIARNAGEEVDEKRICRICYEVLDDGRYDNVKWVKPGFSFDDVKIDARNRAILRDIADQVRLRRRVYEDWGMRSRYAYGRCVSVILAGPPGTGKTMSVHALAAELGLELYKVDLSRIVDKYIGETEKRLEEVFTRAEKSNMILFFDEADAVMGKRSEVRDAQDKYANTEISYILQRIEEFDGIVMLATNNLQNIDQAFMRRIRYVLNFECPDVTTREEIWRGAFGDSVPLSDDIDWAYLAETFDFSGGEIKNVVLNAAFYGAADGGPVSMRHIMKALQREALKQKRGVTFDGDLGKYAYMVTPD